MEFIGGGHRNYANEMVSDGGSSIKTVRQGDVTIPRKEVTLYWRVKEGCRQRCDRNEAGVHPVMVEGRTFRGSEMQVF